MQIAQVLHELTFYEHLPVSALRAADSDRSVALPSFLAEIERYMAGNADDRAKSNPLFFIFHLLGAWREKSAYRPLARLLRLPSGEIDRIFGDGVVSTSHRVMAAVFDGDPQPLYEIILDGDADEYVRSRMCEALAMVALRGELARDEAARFFQACWSELKPEHNCFVWNGWQSAIALLGLADLTVHVKSAFERGSVDKSWLGFEDFERDLRYAIEHQGSLPYMEDREFTLFGDTVEELSKWYGFSPEYDEDKRRRARAVAERSLSSRTEVSLFPKVGRNDPCPCGSGKKFKKCCLNGSTDRSVGNDEARLALLGR